MKFTGQWEHNMEKLVSAEANQDSRCEEAVGTCSFSVAAPEFHGKGPGRGIPGGMGAVKAWAIGEWYAWFEMFQSYQEIPEKTFLTQRKY